MKDKLKEAFKSQRGSAIKRGIDFQFTYEEWINWWGDDIVYRGQGRDKLVMARHGDIGPYHPDNCKKITHSENTIEGNKRRNASEETRRKIGEASRIRNTGRTFTMSDQTKANISAATKGRIPWNKGVSPSPESEQKRIASLKRTCSMRNESA